MAEINYTYGSATIVEQYDALKNGCGIRPVPKANIIRLLGKDTLDFLHRVSTNAIKDLKPYEKVNTLFLNEKGRFIDKSVLVQLENSYLIIGSPDESKRLLSWINKFIIMEDIQTNDVSEEYLFMEMIGPQTESFLTMLIGGDISGLNSGNVIFTEADGFSFFLFKNKLDSKKEIYQLLISRVKSGDFLKYILENKSVFDAAIISDEAYNIARVECGFAHFPNEINDKYNPHETNLLCDVSFNKGCYIGQEVIARLDTYDKVQRILQGVILPEDVTLNGDLNLYDDENAEAGEITSTAESRLIKKKIALAFVRKKVLEENKKVFIKINGDRVPVVLTELPFKR